MFTACNPVKTSYLWVDKERDTAHGCVVEAYTVIKLTAMNIYLYTGLIIVRLRALEAVPGSVGSKRGVLGHKT